MLILYGCLITRYIFFFDLAYIMIIRKITKHLSKLTIRLIFTESILCQHKYMISEHLTSVHSRDWRSKIVTHVKMWGPSLFLDNYILKNRKAKLLRCSRTTSEAVPQAVADFLGKAKIIGQVLFKFLSLRFTKGSFDKLETRTQIYNN